jgi:AraC-like DNA-binding protein
MTHVGGEPPPPETDQRREVRLERARVLMSEHGARAGDVAARVGFETAAHFAREFKRRYGRSPSQYTPRAIATG